MNDEVEAIAHTRHDIEPGKAVLVIKEDEIAAVTTCCDVIQRAGKFKSKWACHAPTLQQRNDHILICLSYGSARDAMVDLTPDVKWRDARTDPTMGKTRQGELPGWGD
ncbi:hypothetical protein [Pseudoduganella aquatica]|uniref:hypothetical protein n=1 Tax=Pseudoduganella aquatica TaxID=2660641 RepID=UPI001E571BA9|nr:hypothetical protein [Pseudoduganella aquatica]